MKFLVDLLGGKFGAISDDFGRTVNWVEEQDLIEPIAQLLRQSKGLQRTKGKEETSKENLQSIHPENLSTSAADNQSFSRPFRSGNL
jgi:hypothetical protein